MHDAIYKRESNRENTLCDSNDICTYGTQEQVFLIYKMFEYAFLNQMEVLKRILKFFHVFQVVFVK